MLILACDTSGPQASVALWSDGRLAAEIVIQRSQPHAVTLMPAVEDLLNRCDLAPTEIDGFACATGPGSFTGIRIGISSIKAMAYGTGRPAIGISTLEAMAWPYLRCPAMIVLPMIDARNRRVFAGAWLNEETILPEDAWQTSDLVGSITDLPVRPASILLVGHRPEAFFDANGQPVIPGTIIAPEALSQSRASVIAEIAEIRLRKDPSASPHLLLPQYLAVSQAERRAAGGRP